MIEALSVLLLLCCVIIWWFSLKNHQLKTDVKAAQHLLRQQSEHSEHFEALAQKVLHASQQQIEGETQKNLQNVITPLKETMVDMQKRMNAINDRENIQYGELKTQLNQLYQLNKQLGDEANNLAKALKGDVKKQGLWGEMILERVLELAGLRKNSEYVTQTMIKGDQLGSIPDTIVYLPNKRHVIIDAKVSLKAYEAYINALDDSSQEMAGRDHLKSIEKHIKNLAEKDYAATTSLNSLDAVLMFIPIESAWQLAQNLDPSILDLSLKHKVLVVTPSSLFTILKIIAQNWELDKRDKNAQEIARLGGSLIDKLANYSSDLEDIEKSLQRAMASYTKAQSKLTTGKGNASSIARRLQTMGVSSKKQLSEIHDEE